MVERGVRGPSDGGTSRAVEAHQSRVGGGVNVDVNESSTATSGQDAALWGHQTARQYAVLPPFRPLPSSLLLPRDGLHSPLCGSSVVHLMIMCFYRAQVPGGLEPRGVLLQNKDHMSECTDNAGVDNCEQKPHKQHSNWLD